jgi:uncharacterized damage-inducible protein DinB
MSPATITEKDQFISAWENEFTTTLKLLRNFPDGKEDYKPADKCRTARELAWIFAMEEKVVEATSKGSLDFTTPPPPPQQPFSEIVKMYETSHRDIVSKVKAMDNAILDKTVKFPVGPGQMGDVRIGQVFWMMLMDSIHHRGQLSVYLRLVGAKVPSIYGPSADEPWR